MEYEYKTTLAQRLANARWRENNPEAYKKTQNDYVKRNPEKNRISSAKYYARQKILKQERLATITPIISV